MVKDGKPKRQLRQLEKTIKENSVKELTFSYLFDCLHADHSKDRFLGFTLSSAYVELYKSKPDELSGLRHYFDIKVLKAIVVYVVYQQTESVIKWTAKDEMEAYLDFYRGDRS